MGDEEERRGSTRLCPLHLARLVSGADQHGSTGAWLSAELARTSPLTLLTSQSSAAPSSPADSSSRPRETPAQHAARAFAPEDVPVPQVVVRGPLIATPEPSSSSSSPPPPSASTSMTAPAPDTAAPAADSLPPPSPPPEVVPPQGEVAAAGVEIIIGDQDRADAEAWQRDRVERKMRGEYERAGKHLAEIVRPPPTGYLSTLSARRADPPPRRATGPRQPRHAAPPQRHPHLRRQVDPPLVPLAHLRTVPLAAPPALVPRRHLLARLAASALAADAALAPPGDA